MARKQRQFSAQFKLETVLEILRGEKPVAQICRERQVTDGLVYKWRQEFNERAAGIFEGKGASKRSSEADEYPTYGYRRLTALLRRAGWTVNHKRVQRLM